MIASCSISRPVAYCALVEDQMKISAPYALVIYAGQQVR
jgi:hypothetical protein